MTNSREAFVTYMQYLALKRHFTSTYDYFKYDGKVSATIDSFERRRDKFFFYQLSKNKFADEIILSNLVRNPKIWVGSLLDDEALEVHKAWKKRQQSLSYNFRSEISQLDDDFDSNFIVKNGQHPKVLRLYIQQKISLETLIILMDLTKCSQYWERNISDTIMWADINNKVKKYRGFMDYEKSKFKKILLDKYA